MPDEEMIRRVDKAILEYIYAQTGTMICNLSVAKVGIAAMREPTEKMLSAENVHKICFTCGGSVEGYQAMIDAVLK